MKRVIFVCTGNTCRSPMAEGLFREYLKKRKIENIEISSAGLSCFAGDSVCENAVKAADMLGADISEHRSRGLNAYDFSDSSYFIAMTSEHKAQIKYAQPQAKVLSLDIPDPYGQDLYVYCETARMITQSFDEIENFVINEIEIKRMTQDDIENVAQIEKECFSDPWSENSLREELSNPVADFFVAEKSGKTAGYVGSFNVLGEVSITNIAVKGQYRKTGIATSLMKHLIRYCTNRNDSFITLEVRQSNENAIRLYEKFEFEKVGERKNFYSHPQENAILMTKKLK